MGTESRTKPRYAVRSFCANLGFQFSHTADVTVLAVNGPGFLPVAVLSQLRSVSKVLGYLGARTTLAGHHAHYPSFESFVSFSCFSHFLGPLSFPFYDCFFCPSIRIGGMEEC